MQIDGVVFLCVYILTICNLVYQNVEDLEPAVTTAPRDPVYSYTRQLLTAETIQKMDPSLYTRMENLQKQLSLAFAGLKSSDDNQLEVKHPQCFDFSVLAAIPSKGSIPQCSS